MEKLVFRAVTEEEETLIFIDKVEHYTNVRLPMEYVRRSRIVGVFSHEKMVAGYMLVTKPGFRSLLFVPDSVKKSNNFFQTDEYEMMEVNGLWIGPSLKSPREQFRFWMHLVRDIFTSRKKYLLLMSDMRNQAIKYIHGLTDPELLYEGAPQLLGPDSTHSQIRIGFTTRWRLALNLPKYFAEYRSRVQRSESRIKAKPIQV